MSITKLGDAQHSYICDRRDMDEAVKDALAAQQLRERAIRRYSRALTRSQACAQRIAELGGDVPTKGW